MLLRDVGMSPKTLVQASDFAVDGPLLYDEVAGSLCMLAVTGAEITRKEVLKTGGSGECDLGCVNLGPCF